MTDYGEPVVKDGFKILGHKGCLAEAQSHEFAERIVACVNALKNINPDDILGREDIDYLIGRLKRVIELIDANEPHMAVAKLLADISALKGTAEAYEGKP